MKTTTRWTFLGSMILALCACGQGADQASGSGQDAMETDMEVEPSRMPGGSTAALTGEELYDDRWQQMVTDDEIAQIIEKGGAAEGLSASMPPHPNLSDAQVESLVEYIRSLDSSA